MAKERKCSDCGAGVVGRDGLCKACRIGRAKGPEAKAAYMASLGRRGAAKIHGPRGLDPGALGELRSQEDARQWLEAIARGVLSGRIGPQAATAATTALRVWLAAPGDAADLPEIHVLVASEEDPIAAA